MNDEWMAKRESEEEVASRTGSMSGGRGEGGAMAWSTEVLAGRSRTTRATPVKGTWDPTRVPPATTNAVSLRARAEANAREASESRCGPEVAKYTGSHVYSGPGDDGNRTWRTWGWGGDPWPPPTTKRGALEGGEGVEGRETRKGASRGGGRGWCGGASGRGEEDRVAGGV